MIPPEDESQKSRSKFPSFKVKPTTTTETEESVTVTSSGKAFALVRKVANAEDILEAIKTAGITPEYLAKQLKTCIEANDIRTDKHGDPIPGINLRLRLNALKLVFMIRNDLKLKIQHDKGGGAEAEALFPDVEIN